MVGKIRLLAPSMHREEQMFIKEVFDANWGVPLCQNVTELENEFASFV